MRLATDLLGCGMASGGVIYQRLDKQHVKPISHADLQGWMCASREVSPVSDVCD